MGSPTKVLFVCGRNDSRSMTGELVWRERLGFYTRSVGVSPKSKKVVSEKDIKWADIIFVMEGKHKKRLESHFSDTLKSKDVHVLNIEDKYTHMSIELITALDLAIKPYIRLTNANSQVVR